MVSKADTLKVALADTYTVRSHLHAASREYTMFNKPEAEARAAVRLLEKTARRLRKSFRLEEGA